MYVSAVDHPLLCDTVPTLYVQFTYYCELLLDFDQTPVHMFSLGKKVYPLLLDTLHLLQLFSSHCDIVHGQCAITLLYVSVLDLHIQ